MIAPSKFSHSTLPDLQRGYSALLEMAQFQPVATLPEIKRANTDLEKAFSDFKCSLFRSRSIGTTNGIIHAEYMAFCELARLNGIKKRRVLRRVEESQDGRVTRLKLARMNISDITPLGSLAGLRMLLLSANQISSISALSRLTALTTLYLQENRISDISPLACITSLEELTVADNYISNIEPLKSLQALTYLNLDSNRVKDIRPLVGLGALEILWLNCNRVVDFSELSSCPKLRFVSVGGDKLPDPVIESLRSLKAARPGITIQAGFRFL